MGEAQAGLAEAEPGSEAQTEAWSGHSTAQGEEAFGPPIAGSGRKGRSE